MGGDSAAPTMRQDLTAASSTLQKRMQELRGGLACPRSQSRQRQDSDPGWPGYLSRASMGGAPTARGPLWGWGISPRED